MTIDELNALPAAEATALLRACVDIPSWADALVARRPLADRASALDSARRLAEQWTSLEVETALAGHPRIGERTTNAVSAREQAGVGEGLEDRLAAGNAAYEARFGWIYLVRAAGRTGEEMLDLLEERLGNDDATERSVTAEQLREITLLRLEGLLT